MFLPWNYIHCGHRDNYTGVTPNLSYIQIKPSGTSSHAQTWHPMNEWNVNEAARWHLYDKQVGDLEMTTEPHSTPVWRRLSSVCSTFEYYIQTSCIVCVGETQLDGQTLPDAHRLRTLLVAYSPSFPESRKLSQGLNHLNPISRIELLRDIPMVVALDNISTGGPSE